ncbi:MAG: type II secretion system F family protein [Planctomycetes bacterium]|nr:type II secretion system F family protein [Planctomycetota bacterium]
MPVIHRELALPAMKQPTGATTAAVFGPKVGRFGLSRSAEPKLKRRELAFILRNLATLVSNGLSLAKSLDTLARERSLRKHTEMLGILRRKVETGEVFSKALAEFPRTFNKVMVNQIRAGEKAGTLAEALERVARQVENANKLRSKVIRKLSYPAFLVGAASLAVSFMLVFVIPVFEETYAAAHIPLPLVTRVLMATGQYAVAYGWMVPLVVVSGVIGLKRARMKRPFALWMDRELLRVPLLGEWLRNLAVLQFIDVFGNLIDSGLKVVDALGFSSGSVGNRAVREGVQALQAAVIRGERFGRELTQMGDLFPPVVGQLIAVGEKTGNLSKATSYIRGHLEQEIERQTNAMVGTIEPVLTISLAAVIATILLAIYLPMFDMIGAASQG